MYRFSSTLKLWLIAKSHAEECQDIHDSQMHQLQMSKVYIS